LVLSCLHSSSIWLILSSYSLHFSASSIFTYLFSSSRSLFLIFPFLTKSTLLSIISSYWFVCKVWWSSSLFFKIPTVLFYDFSFSLSCFSNLILNSCSLSNFIFNFSYTNWTSFLVLMFVPFAFKSLSQLLLILILSILSKSSLSWIILNLSFKLDLILLNWFEFIVSCSSAVFLSSLL